MEEKKQVVISENDLKTLAEVKRISDMSSRAERRREIRKIRKAMGRLAQKVDAWETKKRQQKERQGKAV